MLETFHDLTGDLDYSMLVVTTSDGSRRAGCLVGFATQCSIDPARYLVCLSKANHTYATAEGAEVLVVHALGTDQVELARLFGEATSDEVDKFAACRWHPGRGGAPVLDDCPNRFAGRILERIDVGDHVAFVLEPVEAESAPGSTSLLFSAVKDLEPGHRA